MGFLIFGGLFLTVLDKAVRAAMQRGLEHAALGLGCTGALTAIGIHSLVDFNLYIPANALLLSWIVGIATVVVPSRSNDDAEERPAVRIPASSIV